MLQFFTSNYFPRDLPLSLAGESLSQPVLRQYGRQKLTVKLLVCVFRLGLLLQVGPPTLLGVNSLLLILLSPCWSTKDASQGDFFDLSRAMLKPRAVIHLFIRHFNINCPNCLADKPMQHNRCGESTADEIFGHFPTSVKCTDWSVCKRQLKVFSLSTRSDPCHFKATRKRASG